MGYDNVASFDVQARDLHRALPDLTTGARQEATAVAEADVAPYRDLLQRDSHLMQQVRFLQLLVAARLLLIVQP